jgi:hypothetical protein
MSCLFSTEIGGESAEGDRLPRSDHWEVSQPLVKLLEPNPLLFLKGPQVLLPSRSQASGVRIVGGPLTDTDIWGWQIFDQASSG